MPIREKLVSEISRADIFDLITRQTPEDSFLEFKAEILDPRKPKDRLEFDKGEWSADVAAFANAEGGHILIGVEAEQERAARLKPIAGDQAQRLVDRFGILLSPTSSLLSRNWKSLLLRSLIPSGSLSQGCHIA